MKIVLFGSNGQVGWELQRALAPLGSVIALSRNSKSFCGDLSDTSGIADTVRKLRPDAIVNAAAYTAVDQAESEPDMAERINAYAPKILAQAAQELDAWLVHFSTDYVFDGSGTHPRSETAPTGPINVYGKTKLAGEHAIQEIRCKHLIFRTSWVYGRHGKNFAKSMFDLAAKRDELSVVGDQIGAPSGADLIADVTAHALRASSNRPKDSGLYHLAPKGEVSWRDYAVFVVSHAVANGIPMKTTPDRIAAIPTSEYPTPAQRPLNSRLDTTALRERWNLTLPPWQDGVERYITELSVKQ